MQHVGGYRPDLAYNIALCQYMLKQYGIAHSCVGDIIAKGIKEHPGISRVRIGLERRSGSFSGNSERNSDSFCCVQISLLPFLAILKLRLSIGLLAFVTVLY